METEEGRTKIIWMRRWVRGWRGAKRRSGTKGFYCAGGNNPQRLDHTVSFFTWNLTHNQLQLGCLEVKTPWDGVNSAELFLPANRSDGRPSQQTENKSEVKGREEGIIKQWQPEHTPGLEIWIDNPAWLSWTINYFRLFVTGEGPKVGPGAPWQYLPGPGKDTPRPTEPKERRGDLGKNMQSNSESWSDMEGLTQAKMGQSPWTENFFLRTQGSGPTHPPLRP